MKSIHGTFLSTEGSRRRKNVTTCNINENIRGIFTTKKKKKKIQKENKNRSSKHKTYKPNFQYITKKLILKTTMQNIY